MPAKTIDEVIEKMEIIIQQAKENGDTSGYFAALYLKVTKKVKEKIAEKYFDDNERMEKLDIVFANRYLAAYEAYQNGQPVTESWNVAYEDSKNYWLIVLQHLLLGMNAHINLDLGIAAAEITTPSTISSLHNDFNKINEVLADLVGEVEQELCTIWPTLLKILKWTSKFDTFLINFSMTIARDGAWKFANELSGKTGQNKEVCIQERDAAVAKLRKFIVPKEKIIRMIFGIIRISEKGSVRMKIEDLE